MAYFVGHMSKFSSNVGGLKSHNERDTDNHSNEQIDVTKKDENVELVSSRDSTNSYEQDFKKIMEERYTHKTKSGDIRKVRANQVKFNSFVFSASPDFFEKNSKNENIKYFEDCKKYMETIVDSRNIISAKIHFDETTPHMHLVLVPLTHDGRLASKDIFNRQSLREFQEECPKFLKNQGHDITRGENAQGINKRTSELEYKKEKLNQELKDFEKLYNPSADKIYNNVLEKKIKLSFKKEYKISDEDLNELREKANLCEISQESNIKLRYEAKKDKSTISVLKGELEGLKSKIFDYREESKELSNYKAILSTYPEINQKILEDKTQLEYDQLKFIASKESYIRKLREKSKTTKLNKVEKNLIEKSIENKYERNLK